MKERLEMVVTIIVCFVVICLLAGIWFITSKLPSWVIPALGWILWIGVSLAAFALISLLFLKVAHQFKVVFLTPAAPHMFNKAQGLVSYHRGEFQEFDPPAISPAKEMIVRHIPAQVAPRRNELPPTEVEEVEEVKPLPSLLPSPSYNRGAIGEEPGRWALDRAREHYHNGVTSQRGMADKMGVSRHEATQLLAVLKSER